MKWYITKIDSKIEQNVTVFNAMTQKTNIKTIQPEVFIDLSIVATDFTEDDITLENITKALKQEDRIHPDAPSYQELLAKYYPEFLI